MKQWLASPRLVDNLDSFDHLDLWMPGLVIEVKSKLQPLGPRWTMHRPDVPEADLFVLDELSFRKGMAGPSTPGFLLTYYVLEDRVTGRWFLARLDELAVAPKARLDRLGSSGGAKGKLLFNLSDFRQLANPAVDLRASIAGDTATRPWDGSGCLLLGSGTVPTV